MKTKRIRSWPAAYFVTYPAFLFFADLVSPVVILKDLPDEHHLLLDVLWGKLPAPFDYQRLQTTEILISLLHHRMGSVSTLCLLPLTLVLLGPYLLQCKARMQLLLTFQLSSYCLLTLQGGVGLLAIFIHITVSWEKRQQCKIPRYVKGISLTVWLANIFFILLFFFISQHNKACLNSSCISATWWIAVDTNIHVGRAVRYG